MNKLSKNPSASQNEDKKALHDISQYLSCMCCRPVMRREEMAEFVCMGRSMSYKIGSEDPQFPKGVPIFDSENSPMFFWRHEALAWLIDKTNKYRNQNSEVKS